MARPKKTPAVSIPEAADVDLLTDPGVPIHNISNTLQELEKRIEQLEKLLPKKPQAVCVETPSA